MPLELFPDVLQRVGRWLPFQAIVYSRPKQPSFDAVQLPGISQHSLYGLLSLALLSSLCIERSEKAQC